MSHQPPSLVGSVVERPTNSKASFTTAKPGPSSGFPSVQHRSKSAFARAREAKRANEKTGAGYASVPTIPVVNKASPANSVENRAGDTVKDAPNGSSSKSSEIHDSFVRRPPTLDDEQWRAQMQSENERLVSAMPEEERERHRAEIIEQLGPGVEDVLRRIREARGAKEASEGAPAEQEEPKEESTDKRTKEKEVQKDDNELLRPIPRRAESFSKELVSPSRGILVSNSPPGSRSSTPGKAARKLRFAEVTPSDVHVYQSEPSSPRRPLALLPPPPESSGDDSSVTKISAGDYKGFRLRALPTETITSQSESSEPEEGTPEDIRRRFFPNVAPNNPSLEWIERTDSLEQERENDAEPRFDLSGAVIPMSQRYSLPTHLGLHHHGGSTSAGYTMTDLLSLSRSTVAAQRSTALGVLAKLVRQLSRREPGVTEVKNVDDVRNKALNAGLTALPEKGSLGVIAVDLVWACIVFWDDDLVGDVEGVELRPLATSPSNNADETDSDEANLSADALSTLPYSVLLPELSSLLGSSYLPQESQSQLLAVLHRFARHSIDIGIKISETPRLVGNIVSVFLLTPIPPSKDGPLPNPAAIRFLRTVASASRVGARSLEGPADALLRFVTTATPPSGSPFPRALAEELLSETLRLYTVLGNYGIYASVATTAAEHFGRLSTFIFTSEKVPLHLTIAWLQLLRIWFVCARDPHCTTPTHDLLWSQLSGWGWGDDLLRFREKLLSGDSQVDLDVWSALWAALSAWLQGCRLNSVKGGQGEIDQVSTALGEIWSTSPSSEGGPERRALVGAADSLCQELDSPSAENCEHSTRRQCLSKVAGLSICIADFARLCLACSPQIQGTVDGDVSTSGESSTDKSSWLSDAFAILSQVAEKAVRSPIWEQNHNAKDADGELLAKIQLHHLRSTSAFLAAFVRLSRSRVPQDQWLRLAFAVIRRLVPGEEGTAQWILDEVIATQNSQSGLGGKIIMLQPFFKIMICPDEEFLLSPLAATPNSIQKCTTQVLPYDYRPSTASRHARVGLPLDRSWSCIALDHLLRSGTSPVLTNPDSVPETWSASEADLVQASLSLLAHAQRSMAGSSFEFLALRSEDVVFTCMKVFMLEHNQHQTDSAEEVFRDPLVDRLMRDLLEPFTFRNARLRPLYEQQPQARSSLSMEDATRSFLGSGTPFYQFYTDFLALYDATSFGHQTFARLLLPPTSMRYALDYRKLLWGDFGHVLRSVQTPPEEVVTDGLQGYFWPYETDAEMIGWYLRALFKWPLAGFVRVLAIHHVACNIWPDLHEGAGSVKEKRARMLLQAVINQAIPEVMKDVVMYVQTQPDIRLPPDCFVLDGSRKDARLNVVREWGDGHLLSKLENLYAH